MRQMNTLRSNSASLLKSNAVTKAWQSLGHGLAIVAAILTERAQTALQLLRFTLHRRLSASIQLNQLFRQRQVCLKGLHRDQHRLMTVPESASHNRQLMLTSNTLC